MKQQREDIRGLLVADATLTALAPGGVFSGQAPQTAVMPYIVFRLLASTRPRTHDQRAVVGRKKADRREWAVIAVSEDSDLSSDIAEAIDDCLDGQAVGHTAVLLFDDASDQPEFKRDNSGAVVQQVQVNFIAIRKPE